MWERGYSATSPREVRELSGVGQGSMYHYFPTKRDLGLAALRRNCRAQLDSCRTVLEDGVDGDEDPIEVLGAYLDLPRDPLKGCRVGRMAQDRAVVADEGLRQPVADAFKRLHEMLVAVIDAAVSRGQLPPGVDPDRLASTMVAVVQGGYVLAMAQQDRAPYDAACQGALELLRAVTGETDPAPAEGRSASF
ncbi:TetR/AcrR family transcriptional regulator [Actinomyces viscosus]